MLSLFFGIAALYLGSCPAGFDIIFSLIVPSELFWVSSSNCIPASSQPIISIEHSTAA